MNTNYNHYRKLTGNYSENVNRFQVWLFNLLWTGGNTAALKNWANHVTHVEVTYTNTDCEVHFALWENEILWSYTGNRNNDTELFIEKSLCASGIN